MNDEGQENECGLKAQAARENGTQTVIFCASCRRLRYDEGAVFRPRPGHWICARCEQLEARRRAQEV